MDLSHSPMCSRRNRTDTSIQENISLKSAIVQIGDNASIAPLCTEAEVVEKELKLLRCVLHVFYICTLLRALQHVIYSFLPFRVCAVQNRALSLAWSLIVDWQLAISDMVQSLSAFMCLHPMHGHLQLDERTQTSMVMKNFAQFSNLEPLEFQLSPLTTEYGSPVVARHQWLLPCDSEYRPAACL